MNLRPPPPPEFRPNGGATCLRHPGQNPTGLCAPCLRERLSLLNTSASPATSHSTEISKSSAVVEGRNPTSSSIFSKLRRSNTFSGNKCESVVGFACEPRRNSCHVRVRPSLWALFNMEDERRSEAAGRNCVVESKDRGVLGGTCPVLELTEDGEESHDGEGICGGAVDDNDDDDDEIRVVSGEIGASSDGIRAFEEESIVGNQNAVSAGESSEGPSRSQAQTQKTIKEFIDLESKRSAKTVRRDFKEIAGSFWIAASVFSKKLRKWKRKQRSGGRYGGYRSNGVGLPEMWMRGNRLRETQSEAGEYWFGRRSTDTDPRYSIDLARASVDLIGRRSCDSDSRFSVDGGGSRTSFRESSSRGFMIDPRRASFDGGGFSSYDGRTSFREATAARFPIDQLGRTSFRESSAATGYWIDPGRGSYDGSARTSSFGELAASSGPFRDAGRYSLERNWSIRYSQNNHTDAGLLRFNLPPWKANKKKSGTEKSRCNRSRTILKLYS